ncbi:hypothetical protein HID58_010225 [Brassica napus]|uniref:Uncharacterized protein n=1 Tax=Brassica napus TaxID=3708 RepID=A0ABQ8DV50_BRANA|nr:hypothetical protein HID58_010225 [Brassica napus]
MIPRRTKEKIMKPSSSSSSLLRRMRCCVEVAKGRWYFYVFSMKEEAANL